MGRNIQIGLMIEGQDGLNWNGWKRLITASEDFGFQCLFRSDHFTNPQPPDKDSLELWASLTYAAGNSDRIEFGSLVTPVTFRHPAITARAAAATNDLGGGRLVLGMGAGWQRREHDSFGLPFPPASVRHEMLAEYLDVVIRLLRSDEPLTYDGSHYQLREAILLPRPPKGAGARILVGGNGRRKTMPLAARFADEWNAVFVSPEQFRELNDHLNMLIDAESRPRSAVKRSVMAPTRLAKKWSGAADQRVVQGTTEEWVEQISAFADAGAERIMLQWLDQDDVGGLETIAREVLPHFSQAS